MKYVVFLHPRRNLRDGFPGHSQWLGADGGLYVPAMFPPVSKEKLTDLAAMDYCQRASVILRKYLEDFSIAEIDAAVAAAYGGGKFDAPEVAPLKQLDDQTYVMELFHGPTLAFKDMALQLLPHLITLLRQEKR